MTEQKENFTHTPVLPAETIALLGEGKGGALRFVDGTCGCGGHSSLLLKAFPEAELLGIDRDEEALGRSGKTLAFAGARAKVVHGEFADIERIATENGFTGVDGVLLDIGVSSPQIDDGERGFSFRKNGPLDMRMDRTKKKTASQILNSYSQEALKRIFRDYGEIQEAGRLASAVCKAREKKPFATTEDFALLCTEILQKGKKKGGLPAPTLPFQALRMEVNEELDQLRKGLEGAMHLLKPGGRLAVISFHSLEDRIVKNFFIDMAKDCQCPPGLPVCICNWKPELKIPTRKVVMAGEEELAKNSRAACARLRGAEKISR